MAGRASLRTGDCRVTRLSGISASVCDADRFEPSIAFVNHLALFMSRFGVRVLASFGRELAIAPGAFFIAARNARKSKKARENSTCFGQLPSDFHVFTSRGTLTLQPESKACGGDYRR
jgi:hypothetical protein